MNTFQQKSSLFKKAQFLASSGVVLCLIAYNSAFASTASTSSIISTSSISDSSIPAQQKPKVLLFSGLAQSSLEDRDSQHIELNYSNPVRLSQLLTDSADNLNKFHIDALLADNSAYWAGAGLFEYFPHPIKAEVLSQIKSLSLSRPETLGLSTQQEIVQSLAIGKRVFTPLDVDLVRIDKKYNPLLSRNFTFVLPPRPNHVLVLGAVGKPGQQRWQSRSGADTYIQQALPLNLADNSYATVIQPDGVIETHSIAYWNRNHKDIAPGAAIYLGFSRLPSELSSFNANMIELLRNKAL